MFSSYLLSNSGSPARLVNIEVTPATNPVANHARRMVKYDQFAFCIITGVTTNPTGISPTKVCATVLIALIPAHFHHCFVINISSIQQNRSRLLSAPIQTLPLTFYHFVLRICSHFVASFAFCSIFDKILYTWLVEYPIISAI